MTTLKILTAKAAISSFNGTFFLPPYLNVFLRFCRHIAAAPLYVLIVSEAVVSRYLKRYGRKASEQSQYAAIIAKRRQPIIQLFLKSRSNLNKY